MILIWLNEVWVGGFENFNFAILYNICIYIPSFFICQIPTFKSNIDLALVFTNVVHVHGF